MPDDTDLPENARPPTPASSDDLLREFTQRSGVDYDALVKRARAWVDENPVPADLGPEPLNVGEADPSPKS